MCGIAGIYEYRGRRTVDPSHLGKMTDILVHRGPDGSGSYLSPTRFLGLGHRRLSIIDLQTGDQPMPNEDRSMWVSFNGEIYNFRELRDELRKKGHIFKTASDTEVIVHAFEEWGAACARRLNGIFAISLWDERNQQLYLARDAFGVKPLYFYDDGTRILFASELKALLVDGDVSRQIDPDALNLCLTFRYVPSPWTLFRSIRKLPPASYLIAHRDGVRCGTYREEAGEIDRRRSERDWVEELVALYPGAVQRQMVSDVPIGLSLSSGVDSNTLLALMSRSASQVHTFTVGFEGGEGKDNELEPAMAAARSFSADFKSQVVRETDYLEFMDSYLWHLEEPVGNESAAAYYFVAKLAQPHVKVLLSGQGADEPFAGYPRHLGAYYERMFQRIPSPVVSLLRSLAAPLLRGRESPARLFEAMAEPDPLSTLLSMYSITTPAARSKLFNPDVLRQMHPEAPREFLRSHFDRSPRGTLLERMAFIDARTSLPDNLLLCGDKMAMAASVEMRVPFLDVELMRVAERIPGSLKVSWLKNKVIHKRVCEHWLPRSQVHRRKIGFNNPVDRWLNQKLGAALDELTSSPHSVARTMLNLEVVRELQAQHRSATRDHHRLLFLLLSIEMWNKVFLG